MSTQETRESYIGALEKERLMLRKELQDLRDSQGLALMDQINANAKLLLQVRDLEEERDTLKARLDAAPHGERCANAQYPSLYECNCWKSRVSGEE